MNARFLGVALTALSLTGFCSARESYIPLRTDLSSERPQARVLWQDAEQVQIEIRLPGILLLEGILEGQKWDRIEIPGGGSEQDLGAPEIPHFTRLLMIPPTAGIRAEFEALETTSIADIKLMPAQGMDLEDLRNQALPMKYDPEVYSRNADYPARRLAVGQPAIMRGSRVVTLRTNPVQYNPVTRELKVATRYRVTVHFEGADLRSVPARQIPPSKSWAAMLNSVAFNAPDRETDQTGAGSYLIICQNNASLLNQLQPLVDWKKRKGNSVEIATFQPGATNTAIKQIIQTAYDTWDVPPEFVLLFGDVTGSYALPGWGSSGYQLDHPYSQLDGPDLLPDVAIGRLPAETSTEVQVMINKVLTYEKSPYVASTDWYHQSVLIAQSSYYGPSTIYTNRWIKERMLEAGYTRIDTLWYTMAGSVPATVSNAINNGVTFFNYLGWLGMGGFDNTDIDALTNGSKLPFCTLVAEGTGGFNGESNMEHFVAAGTPTVLKGAIGAIGGATISQHGKYQNILDTGFYAGLFDEGITTAGNVLIRGKLELYNSYFAHDPSQTSSYFHWYALAGDPGTDLYNGPIHFMTCDLPESTTLGENSLTLSVFEMGSNPVEGATVCLFKPGVGEYQSVELTDAGGQVTLPLTLSGAANVKVTVTKHNFYPIVDSLDVIQESVAVGYFSHTVDDDNLGGSSGDDDGIINPAEIVQIPTVFKNYGASITATNVSVSATEADPYVILADATQSFPDLPPGATGNSSGSFLLTVAPDCPDEHIIPLLLQTTCAEGQWDGLLNLEVASWELELLSAVMAGGDTLLSPGESADFEQTIRNVGHKNAASLSAVLRSLDPLVSISDSLAHFGPVIMDHLANCSADPFSLSAALNAPPGHLANLAIFYSSNGAMHADTITITLGSQSTIHPQGPDSYGYYCYDNTDLNYPQHPLFSWLEIDPAFGGTGHQLPINDPAESQDMSVNVALPFAFQYYGEEVDTVTVCSNGWLSTRVNAGLANYENYAIPSVIGPGGMIAPFWDNLITWSGGHVFSEFDSINHRFILEWSRMENVSVSPPTQQTFEVMLFDPAYYATPTGDGEIVFQYYQITEVVGDYESNPYSTVGIESPEQTDGIEVAYWNTYDDPNAAHLQAGRAYKFTAAFSYASPSANLTVALTPYGTPIEIPAEGGSFNFDVQVSNSGAQAANAAVWTMTALPNGHLYGPLFGPILLAVPTGSTLTSNRTQEVPPGAPAGDYSYLAYLGYYPATIFSLDSFPFNKSGHDGSGDWQSGWANTGEAFAAPAAPELPTACHLYPAFPNPFNPAIAISYQLSADSHVSLKVYDTAGRLVAILVDGWREAGVHEVTFDGSDLSSGIYIYRTTVGTWSETGKMILLK